jgi:soluble lytic murein transglycosylase-like protein
LVLLMASLPAGAGEVAVLHSGFRLRADRLERRGERVVLHTGQGAIELEASAIASIEVEEAAPVAPAAVPAPAPPASPPPSARELVSAAAGRYGLPPEFVHSVAAAESGYQPGALSPKGAIGVMQLMPATARALGVDPHAVEQNIEGGTRYLAELLWKYKDDPNPVRRALAAYNAGPGAVDRHNGVPPYRETEQYVERVLRNYWKQVGQQSRAPRRTGANRPN